MARSDSQVGIREVLQEALPTPVLYVRYLKYWNKPRTGADFNEWPQIGVFGNRHPRSALFGPRGRGAPKSAHTHAGRPEIRVSRRRCAATPEIGADLARTENDPRSTRLLEGRPEIDAVRSVCAKRLRSGHRRRGAPQINDVGRN